MGESEHGISVELVDAAALSVVQGLRDAGFDAFLVGGCVRDMLLGIAPKDFDVATNATPEEVRDVFKRSRLVGRRFRIAHVRFGRETIEVSTFRRRSTSTTTMSCTTTVDASCATKTRRAPSKA